VLLISRSFLGCWHEINPTAFAKAAFVQLGDYFLYRQGYRFELASAVAIDGVLALRDHIGVPVSALCAGWRIRALNGYDLVGLALACVFFSHSWLHPGSHARPCEAMRGLRLAIFGVLGEEHSGSFQLLYHQKALDGGSNSPTGVRVAPSLTTCPLVANNTGPDEHIPCYFGPAEKHEPKQYCFDPDRDAVGCLWQ
jgi:hypothetical protein